MQDLTIALENRPGSLADMGEALGRANISVEGGGAWVVDGFRGMGARVPSLMRFYLVLSACLEEKS